ncbi:unnamed protein product [Trichobilharzia szidati]|nr:unnamed protein product [Trichobilharzia szidati]
MLELKLMRRFTEPIHHFHESKTNKNQPIAYNITFNKNEQTRILAMPVSLYRRKYLQKCHQWIKDTTSTPILNDEDTIYVNTNKRISSYDDENNEDLTVQDAIQSEIGDINNATTTTTTISNNNADNNDDHCNDYHPAKYYFLKTNHQIELIHPINNSTNFFFTLANQIQDEYRCHDHGEDKHFTQIWTHREKPIDQKKVISNALKETLKRRKTKKEMEFNQLKNTQITQNTAFNSVSNFLLHCVTIDECPLTEQLDSSNSYSSYSPCNQQTDDMQTTEGTITISEVDKTDTTYEYMKRGKRKKSNIFVNLGPIPKEINRSNFYKHRKYVNQPFKLMMSTHKKRPDPFI